MNKNSKKTKKFSIPRNLVFIGSILLTIIVIFSVWFGISYSNNKVKPFEEDLAEVDYKKIKAKNLDDFTFDFYCSDFMGSSKSKCIFVCTAYDKAPDNGKITNVSIKVQLAANWIGYTSSQASGSLKDSTYWWSTDNHDEDVETPYDATKATLTITGIDETFPKASFFLGIKVNPKAYVWLSYTATKNGKSTNYNYLIEYKYKDYFTSETL